MEMPAIALLSVTPIYIAILGLIFVPITLRVGAYRIKNQVNIGDGGDDELIRRIRGQANFTESVPLACILLVAMELMGAGDTWLHALGATLVVARLLHYVGITGLGPFAARPLGMVGTFTVFLVSTIWILYSAFS